MTTQTNPIPSSPAAAGALACLALTMLLSSLGTSIANVGLPTFVHAFDASFQSVQWVVLAYLLAITTLVVSAGRLGDLFGRRLLMLVGIGLFTVASLACAAAPALWVLIAARAGQGLGAAMMMAMTMAMVGVAVPKARLGRAMGLLGTMSAVGTALGPSLGGVLIGHFGWQAIFLVNLPLGLLAAVLALRFLQRDRRVVSTSGFDVPGALLLGVALAAYSLAMTPGQGHFGALNLAFAIVAIVVGMFFLRVESKSRSPLVQLALFREPLVGSGFVSSGLATTVAMTTLVVGPFYLSAALQFVAIDVGLVMSAGPLAAALVGVPAGKAVDRYGALRVSVTGLLLMAAGALLLSRLTERDGVSGYIIALVTLTSGFAAFQTANNSAVLGGSAAAQRGVVSGLLTLSRNLGLVTGASLMGAVFMHASGASTIASASKAAVISGFHAAFLVATGLILVALAVVIAFRAKASTNTPLWATLDR